MDWKVSETKSVEGYEDVKPVYIHMETDREKDILTIGAGYYEDFSKPFSKRTFSLKDSSTSSNPNDEVTVGEVTPEKIPSIDIENAHDKLPNPGESNHKDIKQRGENDRDTADTAPKVEAGKTTAIKCRFTNNSTEALTHLKVSEKTIEGGISIKILYGSLMAKNSLRTKMEN